MGMYLEQALDDLTLTKYLYVMETMYGDPEKPDDTFGDKANVLHNI